MWFDQSDLSPGGDWEHGIEDGLDWLAADRDKARMILLLTPYSVRRPDGYCLNEVARAVSRRIGIIPVMVAMCEPPLSICRIQYLDMQGCVPLSERTAEYSSQFDKLAHALESGGFARDDSPAVLKMRTLEPLDFTADLSAHIGSFIGRQWLLSAIDEWLSGDDPARVFVLVGPPGIGKTALSIQLIHGNERVSAFHLCMHSSQQKTDPLRLVTSLAYQLSTQLPDYDGVLSSLDLEYVVREYDAETLFDVLLTQPLAHLRTPVAPVVVVVDGLDEATRDGRNRIAELMAEQAGALPSWLRLVVTTRPEPEVVGPLSALGLHYFEAEAPENLDDVREYVRLRLMRIDCPASAVEHVVRTVVDRSEGVMLYAKSACDFLESNGVTPENVATLPEGLSSLYASLLRNRCPDLGAYRVGPRRVLAILLAGMEGVPSDLLPSALDISSSAVWDVITELGSMVSDDGESLTLSHKSVGDWLKDRRRSSAYYVSADEGHEALAGATMRASSMPPRARAYLHRFGPRHVLHSRGWPELWQLFADPAFDSGCRILVRELVADESQAQLLCEFAETTAADRKGDVADILLDCLREAVTNGHWGAVAAVGDAVETALTMRQRAKLDFLRAWTLQLTGRLQESLAAYEALGVEVHDGEDGFVEFEHANATRESGSFDVAFAVYRRLAETKDHPSKLHVLYAQQYADLLFVRGKYTQALGILDAALSVQGEALQGVRAEALRIRGHVHRVLLDEDPALADYGAAGDLFSSIGNRSGIARIETNLAEAFAFFDPTRALWHADRAYMLNDGIGRPLESGKAIRAKGLALALLRRFDEASGCLDEAERILAAVGYRAGVCETQANRVLLLTLLGDLQNASQVTVALSARLRDLNAYPLLVVRSCMAIESAGPLPAELSAIYSDASAKLELPAGEEAYRAHLKAILQRAS